MKLEPKIGVFDSGVGGLTVLKSLLANGPHASYVYLGDSARTPYGTKSKETVIGYSFECAQFLLSHDIDMLVVACNTASVAALPALKATLKIPVFGMIEPASHDAVNALEKDNESEVSHIIAVIGTEATVQSRAYDDFIKELSPLTKVVGQACPLFVPIIEQGIFSGAIVDEVMRLYLSGIRDLKPASVILACTHYPLLKPEIQKFIGKQTQLISCSDSIGSHLMRHTELFPYVQDRKGRSADSVSYFTTDSVDRFNKLGTQILSSLDVIVEAEKVQL